MINQEFLHSRHWKFRHTYVLQYPKNTTHIDPCELKLIQVVVVLDDAPHVKERTHRVSVNGQMLYFIHLLNMFFFSLREVYWKRHHISCFTERTNKLLQQRILKHFPMLEHLTAHIYRRPGKPTYRKNKTFMRDQCFKGWSCKNNAHRIS